MGEDPPSPAPSEHASRQVAEVEVNEGDVSER